MIREFFRKLFGLDRFEFRDIALTRDAARQIIEFAKRAHPREFSALLEGQVKKGTLVIEDVVYQQFEASDRAAIIHINVPLTTHIVGSCHSHPSSNVMPSGADKRYFNKYGYVNFIIGYPYTLQTITCYDAKARPVPFRVL